MVLVKYEHSKDLGGHHHGQIWYFRDSSAAVGHVRLSMSIRSFYSVPWSPSELNGCGASNKASQLGRPGRQRPRRDHCFSPPPPTTHHIAAASDLKAR